MNVIRGVNKLSPSFAHYCPDCKETVPTSIAYGLENLRKHKGNVVTVCFICERKEKWTNPQEKARLRELIAATGRILYGIIPAPVPSTPFREAKR
jgi:hypothetical protein